MDLDKRYWLLDMSQDSFGNWVGDEFVNGQVCLDGYFTVVVTCDPFLEQEVDE